VPSVDRAEQAANELIEGSRAADQRGPAPRQDRPPFRPGRPRAVIPDPANRPSYAVDHGATRWSNEPVDVAGAGRSALPCG